MSTLNLRGVYTALVTPFAADGAVDERALRDLVDYQIEGGVAGLVPVGTTGESPTVSHTENIRIIEVVVEQAAGRVPVIAGTGSNATAEAIDMTRRAGEVGAAASLQVAPYYNKPTQEGLFRHFSSVADAVDLPMVVYNIPGRTGVNVETDTLARLASHPNIVAVKEASGNVPQMMDVLARLPDSFAVLSGDDNLAFSLTALGGSGVISVASNAVPRRMSDMIAATLDGDLHRARSLHYDLLPLFKAIFLETNPIPIKYLLAGARMLSLHYRLPLVEPEPATAAALDQIIARYELS